MSFEITRIIGLLSEYSSIVGYPFHLEEQGEMVSVPITIYVLPTRYSVFWKREKHEIEGYLLYVERYTGSILEEHDANVVVEEWTPPLFWSVCSAVEIDRVAREAVKFFYPYSFRDIEWEPYVSSSDMELDRAG